MGRKRIFFARWGDELFRQAYSFVPQSTVADCLNFAMVKLYNMTEGGEYTTFVKPQLMLQVHDSFVVQCRTDPLHVEQTIHIIKEAFNIPIYIKGRTLRIPVKLKWGRNWEEMEEVE